MTNIQIILSLSASMLGLLITTTTLIINSLKNSKKLKICEKQKLDKLNEISNLLKKLEQEKEQSKTPWL